MIKCEFLGSRACIPDHELRAAFDRSCVPEVIGVAHPSDRAGAIDDQTTSLRLQPLCAPVIVQCALSQNDGDCTKQTERRRCERLLKPKSHKIHPCRCKTAFAVLLLQFSRY